MLKEIVIPPDTILYEVRDRIVYVTLNRSEVLNALNRDMVLQQVMVAGTGMAMGSPSIEGIVSPHAATSSNTSGALCKSPSCQRRTAGEIIEVTLERGGNHHMGKNEKTSKRVARKASALLRSPKSPAKTKSVAGSALTQAPDRKRKRR